MFGYRLHVHQRYLDAWNAASELSLSFDDALRSDDPKSAVPALSAAVDGLRVKIDALSAALPHDLRERPSDFSRHLHFLKYYLDSNAPQDCRSDIVDITQRDLPGYWERFAAWYSSHSLSDTEFQSRVSHLLESGDMASALRLAWPIFKTRVTRAFGLDDAVDGDALAVAVFGPNGQARKLFDGATCEGYMNLLKGLYAINRNPISHNDSTPDQQEAEGVLMLLNSTLARIEQARGAAAPTPPVPPGSRTLPPPQRVRVPRQPQKNSIAS